VRDDKKAERKPPAEVAKGEQKNIHGQGSGDSQQYQRGGSSSEGGFAEEESHGPDRDLTKRGGGTGARETEQRGNQAAAPKTKAKEAKNE
jgi:hypothetical protein